MRPCFNPIGRDYLSCVMRRGNSWVVRKVVGNVMVYKMRKNDKTASFS